jgi:hypothetical protein
MALYNPYPLNPFPLGKEKGKFFIKEGLCPSLMPLKNKKY